MSWYAFSVNLIIYAITTICIIYTTQGGNIKYAPCWVHVHKLHWREQFLLLPPKKRILYNTHRNPTPSHMWKFSNPQQKQTLLLMHLIIREMIFDCLKRKLIVKLRMNKLCICHEKRILDMNVFTAKFLLKFIFPMNLVIKIPLLRS